MAAIVAITAEAEAEIVVVAADKEPVPRAAGGARSEEVSFKAS